MVKMKFIDWETTRNYGTILQRYNNEIEVGSLFQISFFIEEFAKSV